MRLKLKYILIPTGIIAALFGGYLLFRGKKPLFSSTDKGSGKSGTKPTTEPEKEPEKAPYPDDEDMILLMNPSGKDVDVFSDKGLTLLKKSKTVIGYASLADYNKVKTLDGYVGVYAYMGLDSGEKGIFKVGYVKKSDGVYSSTVKYSRLKEILGIK